MIPRCLLFNDKSLSRADINRKLLECYQKYSTLIELCNDLTKLPPEQNQLVVQGRFSEQGDQIIGQFYFQYLPLSHADCYSDEHFTDRYPMSELFIICDAKEGIFLVCNLNLDKGHPFHQYKIETLPNATLYKAPSTFIAQEFITKWADQPGFHLFAKAEKAIQSVRTRDMGKQGQGH